MTSAENLLDECPGLSEQQRISDAVQAITERRALIEQSKGMLMFVYGIDADAAFELLRRQSQNDNVKLRDLAGQLLVDLVELSKDSPARQLAFDGLMHTARQRITRFAARQMNGERRTDDRSPEMWMVPAAEPA
ncbi:MAG TPA: ANTAR domain-containing protein [Mycobacterium sp.]